jgi:hypothetical protein
MMHARLHDACLTRNACTPLPRRVLSHPHTPIPFLSYIILCYILFHILLHMLYISYSPAYSPFYSRTDPPILFTFPSPVLSTILTSFPFPWTRSPSPSSIPLYPLPFNIFTFLGLCGVPLLSRASLWIRARSAHFVDSCSPWTCRTLVSCIP